MNIKKKVIIAIIGVAAIIIAAVIGFLFYINSDTVKIKQRLDLGEVETQEAWKQAYIDLVNQYEAGQYEFDDEGSYDDIEEYITECGYSLINLDNKGVPELVIACGGPIYGGYATWIYTYDNNMLYKMAELPGSGLRARYEYIEGEGTVVLIAADGAGAINRYYYYQIDSNNQLVLMYDEILHTNGEPGDIHYYYGDTEITEEEYEAYYEERHYDYYESASSSEIINEINNFINHTCH